MACKDCNNVEWVNNYFQEFFSHLNIYINLYRQCLIYIAHQCFDFIKGLFNIHHYSSVYKWLIYTAEQCFDFINLLLNVQHYSSVYKCLIYTANQCFDFINVLLNFQHYYSHYKCLIYTTLNIHCTSMFWFHKCSPQYSPLLLCLNMFNIYCT